MVGYGIRCSRCEGLYSGVDEVRGAPDRRVPVIVRVRRCVECDFELVTLEVLPAGDGPHRIRLPDARELLRAIRAERHALARGVK